MHRLIHGPNVVVDKVDVKKDAWLCKGFAVLVKRNYSRGRLNSQHHHFAALMLLLSGSSAEACDHSLCRLVIYCECRIF